MSRLISRIMLAVFMLPLSAMIYTIIAALAIQGTSYPARQIVPWLTAGFFTWAVIAFYWVSLWCGAVRWNGSRVAQTFWIAVGSAGFCIFLALVLDRAIPGFGWFAGTARAPMLWLVGSTLVWRETPVERAARLRSVHGSGIVCPLCGYNLTGLSEARCPECGGKFTLDELFAAQPDVANTEVES